MSIQWGYSQFPPKADQKAALNQIIDNARARGLTFLTDQDARPPGSASPVAHLWDNGKNVVDELSVVMKVRAQALQRFGADNIPPGTPMAMLEDTLVPVYLYHRYQVEAATKVVGGLQYSYALRGDGQVPTAPIAPEEQRRALSAVLATISPDALAVPDRIQKLIPPHPAGYNRTRESFATHTGMTFDPIGAAQTAAESTLTTLLDPERASAIVAGHGQRSSPARPVRDAGPALDGDMEVAARHHERRGSSTRGGRRCARGCDGVGFESQRITRSSSHGARQVGGASDLGREPRGASFRRGSQGPFSICGGADSEVRGRPHSGAETRRAVEDSTRIPHWIRRQLRVLRVRSGVALWTQEAIPARRLLAISLEVGFQVQVLNEPVQILGVNSQQACSLDVAPVRVVHRRDHQLLLRLVERVVIQRRHPA